MSQQIISVTSSAAGNFTVAQGLGVSPSSYAINMTSGGMIWWQTPTLFDSNNLYLVASDAGITANIIISTTQLPPAAGGITVQQTINWAQTFVGYAPLANGTNNEPAITNANIILQTILSPPFKWRWNRASLTPFTTTAGTQDYQKAVSSFGYLEKAYINGQIELEVKQILSADTLESRPNYVSALLDDGAGNITFRLLPNPDNNGGSNYSVTPVYQLSAPQITTLVSTWAPIPTFMEYIYSWGFLSLTFDYLGDPRGQLARQIFVGSLLAVAEGLDESEKQIFRSIWLRMERDELTAQAKAQMGARARMT